MLKLHVATAVILVQKMVTCYENHSKFQILQVSDSQGYGLDIC